MTTCAGASWPERKPMTLNKIDQHKEVLFKAAAIKTQIKSLEEEYNLIKPSLETAVIELTANAEKQEVNIPEIGKFCRTKGPTKWEYTPLTKAMIKELDERKAAEQANGKAIGAETFVIKFFGKKEDDNG